MTKPIVKEVVVIRQIIVFTKSPHFNTVQQLKEASESLGILFRCFNPFQEGSHLIGSLEPPLPQPLASDTLLLPRTSGVLFDDWDLQLAGLWQEKFSIQLSHPLKALETLRDKARQALWLEKHQLPFIPTLIPRGILKEECLKRLSSTGELLEHYVLKSIRGNKGIGVEKFTLKELISFWEKTDHDQRYLIQPLIEGQKEVRILCLGEKLLGIEKKSREWKKNGQSSEFIPFTEKAHPVFALSRRIQKLLDCPNLAIDCFLEGEEATIIEINANPGIEYASYAYPQENLALSMLNSFGIR